MKLHISNNFKESILASILIFSAFIVFLTETLSLFTSLNLISVAFSWSLITILLSYFLLKDKVKTIATLRIIKFIISDFYKSLSIFGKIVLYFITIGLLCLLFQGIIYPPNNWDSLTYHMSRIMYWLGNESVSHFPTHILRHLYQPPFAEYFILNVNLLNGNDYFSNSVQWLFLVFSILAIWSVLDFFEVSKFHKLLAAFLIITIPSVELQSSTTKNDIVCGFFVITTLYFCLKTFYETNLKNFVFLGLAIGLGMFTKGTAYLFLTPILFLFVFSMIYLLFKQKKFNVILNGFVLIAIVLSINIGHYARNFKINNNIINIDDTEAKTYSNSEMNSKLFVSNLLKNVGLHVGYPFQTYYDVWINKFHLENNININNPETNFLGIKYSSPKEYETHEDLVQNSNHFYLLFVFCFIIFFCVFRSKKNTKELLILLIFLIQIVLFTGYLKWQPWHTRLHIPLFMFSVLIIIIGLKKSKFFNIIVIFFFPFLVNGFYFNFVYNNLRPIITDISYTKNITIKDVRFKKYFSNQTVLYKEYSKVLNLIHINKPKKIGLMLSDWEYPLFNEYYYDRIKLEAVFVNNITAKLPQNIKNINLIISNIQKTPNIEINGIIYKNKTPENLYIWCYK